MSKRTDYYDDPTAPKPNSIVPAGSAVIVNADGDVLLHRRSDSGLWTLPGGAMEIGETMSQAVVREVEEETGIRIAIAGLVGLYTDPRHVIAYANGEVRQQFNVSDQSHDPPVQGTPCCRTRWQDERTSAGGRDAGVAGGDRFTLRPAREGWLPQASPGLH